MAVPRLAERAVLLLGGGRSVDFAQGQEPKKF